jgi:hypothetical protein
MVGKKYIVEEHEPFNEAEGNTIEEDGGDTQPPPTRQKKRNYTMTPGRAEALRRANEALKAKRSSQQQHPTKNKPAKLTSVPDAVQNEAETSDQPQQAAQADSDQTESKLESMITKLMDKYSQQLQSVSAANVPPAPAKKHVKFAKPYAPPKRSRPSRPQRTAKYVEEYEDEDEDDYDEDEHSEDEPPRRQNRGSNSLSHSHGAYTSMANLHPWAAASSSMPTYRRGFF